MDGNEVVGGIGDTAGSSCPVDGRGPLGSGAVSSNGVAVPRGTGVVGSSGSGGMRVGGLLFGGLISTRQRRAPLGSRAPWRMGLPWVSLMTRV